MKKDITKKSDCYTCVVKLKNTRKSCKNGIKEISTRPSSVIFVICHLVLSAIIPFYKTIFILFRTYFCRAYYVIKSWRDVVHDHRRDLNANV